MVKGTKCVGYVRVSSEKQADSQLSLKAQKAAIQAECERRSWILVTILEDAAVSGKSTEKRPGLEAARGMLRAGAAECLIVSKLDRLSRSVVDFGKLIEEAQSEHWSLVVLDQQLDMTTANGRMVAGVLMQFAQFERELASERTKAALQQKRAEGVKLGRNVSTPPRVVARIRREHDNGKSLRAIAAGLNDDAIPTAQGGAAWHASTVKAILDRT